MFTLNKLWRSALLVGAWTTWACAQAPDPAAPAGTNRPPSANYTKERIEQLVAPIALYPDALLAQMLMAATYPTEIAQATAWLHRNLNLDPSAVNQAAQNQPWDASVKSLLPYEAVLNKMNDNLNWTKDLGNAVLGQQQEVFDTIQRLRLQARSAGNLASDSHVTVIVQTNIVQIQPADQTQVYVPAYNPTTVYGSGWSYPVWYYPGVYYYYGIPWQYRNYGLYGNAAWREHQLAVDAQRARNLYNSDPQFRHDVDAYQHGYWQHNPDHRSGVPYSNVAAQNWYANQMTTPQNNLNQYRGYHVPGNTTPDGYPVYALKPNATPSVRNMESPRAHEQFNVYHGYTSQQTVNAYRSRGTYSRASAGYDVHNFSPGTRYSTGSYIGGSRVR